MLHDYTTASRMRSHRGTTEFYMLLEVELRLNRNSRAVCPFQAADTLCDNSRTFPMYNFRCYFKCIIDCEHRHRCAFFCLQTCQRVFPAKLFAQCHELLAPSLPPAQDLAISKRAARKQ